MTSRNISATRHLRLPGLQPPTVNGGHTWLAYGTTLVSTRAIFNA
jgi:hypothetical protein